MELKFQTREDNGETVVVIIKDQIEIAKIKTDNPLVLLEKLISRVKAEPHMIFSAEVIIIGADLQLREN